MDILFLSDNFWPETNAPATRLYEHARNWSRAGHAVTVVTSAPNFPQGRVFEGYENRWYGVEEVAGARVVRVKTYITANEGVVKRTLDYISFMVAGALGGLFQRRPDLVVATSPQFFSALGGWALAGLRRVPFVLELRDLWPASIAALGAVKNRWILSLLERLELFVYRRARRIVCVTEAFRRDLVERGIDAAKIDVVVNGIDLTRFSPTAGKDPEMLAELGLENRFVVGYLGTHGMSHGLESVVEAAALLADRPEVVFLFAGAGAEKENVRRLVTERGLSSVIMLPLQPRERMPALWSVCDAALIPLLDRPVFSTVIPSKLFEAMGMGVPVLLALPDGEAAGIVRDTGVGLTIAPEHPEALAAAVRRLLDDPDLVARFRRACAERAPDFSRERLAEDMLRSFAAAIGQSPAAPVTDPRLAAAQGPPESDPHRVT